MELWCFLHAFQQSSWKYFYFNPIVRSLSLIDQKKATLKEFKEIFFNENPELKNHIFWDQIEEKSKNIYSEEVKAFKNFPCHFVFLGHENYPEGLKLISDPPLALSYSGEISEFKFMQSLSVVGSREPNELSKSWMKEDFYSFLKKYPQPIVSGGARGIDLLAHQIAIFLECPTCVVLPSGLSQKYPKIWNSEGDWIKKKVTFISEILLSKPISKFHFTSRNRIIAGLSNRILIVEAKSKSGTIMTAHQALLEGREVGIVPGHPKMLQFEGSLNLIDQGAKIIRHFDDLADKFS